MEKYLKDEPRRSLQPPSSVVVAGTPGVAGGALKKSHSEMDLGTTMGTSGGMGNPLSGGPWDRFQHHPLLLHLPHGGSSSTAFSEDSKTGSDRSDDNEDTDSEDRLSLDDLNLWDLTSSSSSKKGEGVTAAEFGPEAASLDSAASIVLQGLCHPPAQHSMSNSSSTSSIGSSASSAVSAASTGGSGLQVRQGPPTAAAAADLLALKLLPAAAAANPSAATPPSSPESGVVRVRAAAAAGGLSRGTALLRVPTRSAAAGGGSVPRDAFVSRVYPVLGMISFNVPLNVPQTYPNWDSGYAKLD